MSDADEDEVPEARSVTADDEHVIDLLPDELTLARAQLDAGQPALAEGTLRHRIAYREAEGGGPIGAVLTPLLKESAPLVEYVGEVGGAAKDEFLGNASVMFFLRLGSRFMWESVYFAAKYGVARS